MNGPKNSDDTKAFEQAVASGETSKHYVLRLYVTGTTPRSARAIQNIRAICNDQLRGRCDLEVIDIYQYSGDLKPEQIVVTPTLVKMLPPPVRRIIGDLSNTERVLVGLDLVPNSSPK